MAAPINYGRSSDVQIVGNVDHLFDEDFPNAAAQTFDKVQKASRGSIEFLSGAKTMPSPDEIVRIDSKAIPRPTSTSSTHTLQSMIRRSSMGHTAPGTSKELQEYETSSYAGSRNSSARSRLSSAGSRVESALERLGNLRGSVADGMRSLKNIPSFLVPKLSRTDSMRSIASNAGRQEWDTVFAKDINKMTRCLIILDQIKKHPTDEALREQWERLGNVPQEVIFEICGGLFSTVEEVFNKKGLTLQEVNELQSLFKAIVNIKYDRLGSSETDLMERELVSKLFNALKTMPHELSIKLIDAGLICRLARNEWCSFLQKMDAEFKHDQLLVLLDIPAVKTYLTYISIRENQYDAFSALLGMHRLHSEHFSNSKPIERTKCKKFAETLRKAHFHPASDVFCNISIRETDCLYGCSESAKGLNFQRLNTQVELQEAIKECMRQFSQAINQLGGNLLSDNRLLIDEQQREDLCALGEESAKDFYDEFIEMVLQKMGNDPIDPRTYRQQLPSSFSNFDEPDTVNEDRLSPLTVFKELFDIEIVVRGRSESVAASRVRASSVAEEKDSLEGTSIIDDEI